MSVAAEKITGTLNQEATELRRLKEIKDDRAAELKAAEKEFKEQEQVILDLMDEQGLEMTRIPGVATLTTTFQESYNAEDWAEVFAFIENNSMPHILQKRLSAKAIKELNDQGVEVPGVAPFRMKKLSMRKA